MSRLTRNEMALRDSMNGYANSYEQHADAAPAAVNPAATRLANAKGNPAFAAQFDIQFLLKYFSIVDATGVYTQITPAALVAAQPGLGTQLPAFLYGNSDYSSGFAKLRQSFPLQGGWSYGDPFTYGKNFATVNSFPIDAQVKSQLKIGDVVIPVFFDAGATTYVGLTIVRCTQVAYATLLDSLNSDRFVMNMIRYIMSDTTAVGLAQFNNNIFIFKQSLFGKFDSDFISPTSFKLPEQFQSSLIDIPLSKGIDKQVALATYINYDAVNVQWSLFVETVEKISFGV